MVNTLKRGFRGELKFKTGFDQGNKSVRIAGLMTCVAFRANCIMRKYRQLYNLCQPLVRTLSRFERRQDWENYFNLLKQFFGRNATFIGIVIFVRSLMLTE
jgi:hypothetical protein